MLGIKRLTVSAPGVLAIALVAITVSRTAAAEPPAALAPDSLTATVRDVREHGIDVITGVQLALYPLVQEDRRLLHNVRGHDELR